MNNKVLILILVSYCFIACSKGRQSSGPVFNKILPGDSQLNPGKISTHKISYKKMTGSMTYNLTEVSRNGEEVYLVEVYFGDNKKTPDKMYFDRSSLGYKGRRLEMKDYTIDVSYKEGSLKGDLVPSDDSDYSPVKYNKEYSHNAFEPAIINYFIAALPLEKGFKASLPTFDLNNGSSIVWANVEVLDEEVVTINDTVYDTWKVLSIGIKEKTIWISKEHGYAVKMKTKGAGVGTWKLSGVYSL